jgi:hypothetical protein
MAEAKESPGTLAYATKVDARMLANAAITHKGKY